ncbi:hypothetical protein JOY44_05055 [Phormidium sp. CLA17]|uniref:hypothetical protein n=1 Tax=Leptolyngbya sp. Cla-17 TaxID=2803751 RepID=UPI001491786B|nr:hypothetical protein [Leptolyngbya sp. Cla-17]MBM0740991.1 hypothetical protein [Leptolyngbya sp. Cla-17]
MENFAYTYWNWNKEIEQCATAPIASGDSAKTIESDRDFSDSQPNTWLNSSISDSASLEFDAQACPTYFLM